MPSFFIHIGLKSFLPFVNSIIHSALRQAMPCVDQVLSQIDHVLNMSELDPASCHTDTLKFASLTLTLRGTANQLHYLTTVFVEDVIKHELSTIVM